MSLHFGPYRLDPRDERLWRGTRVVRVTRKALQVLGYVVDRPGQLVTKEELFRAVWPATVVSDAALTRCIRELRKALRDDAQAPRYLETVHRRGFRFIRPVVSRRQAGATRPQPATGSWQLATRLVGREAELEQLQRWLAKALAGERQIVVVTGEAGIGKTALVEAFLEQVAAQGRMWIGRGQCIARHGAGEAYMPVLEALERLCREPRGERLIKLLRRQAPTWLVQMPVLLNAATREKLQREVHGATRERMLREMAEALAALTVERGLVLWFDDLQWSDVATLDLLSVLARRLEPARLVVLGTYRPVDVIVREHPLKGLTQELQLHGQCAELPLEFLSEAAVAEYLALRFTGGTFPAELARVIHHRTDGNPLFMVNVVDDLVRRGLLVPAEGGWVLKGGTKEVEVGVPESIRQLVERHLEQLSPGEQRMLEVASVGGAGGFSAATVAAGLETDAEEVEERCEELVRREQFLKARGTAEWPDGTVAACYAFLHALYQDVVYERMTARRRIQLHKRIGERTEAAYGGNRAGEIAAELALHFEQGRDDRRAVQYSTRAGENAMQRHAYREAIDHFTKGLELLKRLPNTPERTRQELMLHVALSVPLVMTKGYAAPAVEEVYTRARELGRQAGETPHLVLVLMGLWRFHLLRAELQAAHETAAQLLELAHSLRDPTLLLTAHAVVGGSLLFRGEVVAVRAHVEQGIGLYDLQQHRSLIFQYGDDPGVFCFSWAAWVLWYLGYPDQSRARRDEALSLAEEISHPFGSASALSWAAWLDQFRRERQAVQARAEALITLANEQGFAYFLAYGTILRGWALATRGQGEQGVTQVRQGLAALRALGQELGRPYFLSLLAEACAEGGRVEEGLTVLAEALEAAHRTGECLHAAELYRFKGELTLRSNPRAETEADACFRQAVEVARRQGAKSLELRAVMSLGRLWRRQGRKAEARQMLADVYGWFTEGFDTADLQAAKALLNELRYSAP